MKFVERDGRTTKPPVNPHTGRFAKNNAPSDWGSYEQALARAYADGLAGLGYVLTADDGLTGADLDKVRDPVTGELDDWAAEIVGLGETYCEVSPSGRGLRLFWEGKVERAVKSDKHSVEIYGTGRYLTITGNRVEDCPDEIRPAPRTEAALRARVSGKPDDGDLPEHLRGYKSQGIGVDIGPEPLSRWQELNAEALARLDDWVPAVFGDKARKQASGGYRVSSKDLGRDLEEDLSLTPEGIKDFGVADQGDERQGKRSPIDVVMEHTKAKDLDAAFAWLSQKLGRKPDAKERTDADVTPPPYAWIDPAKVPRRSWLYAPHYVRQFVSLTVSTGGVGKSSLIVVEALAMASGRPLLKLKAEGPFRVWYWNGEDPMEELQRRFAAAARHHGLRAEDLGDRLFVGLRSRPADRDRGGQPPNRHLGRRGPDRGDRDGGQGQPDRRHHRRPVRHDAPRQRERQRGSRARRQELVQDRGGRQLLDHAGPPLAQDRRRGRDRRRRPRGQRPPGGGQDRAVAQHNDGPGGEARRGRRAFAEAPLPLRPRQDQPLATGGGGLLVQARLG